MTAADDLRALLSTDWQPALKVQRRMESAGYTINETRTARRKLGVTKEMGGVGFRDGHWHWRLPPNGCVACGRPWHPEGSWGDYWTHDRPSPPITTEEDEHIAHEGEPPVPITPPSQRTRPEPMGPPVCSVCRRASAMPVGVQCPWQTVDGRRCVGVLE